MHLYVQLIYYRNIQGIKKTIDWDIYIKQIQIKNPLLVTSLGTSKSKILLMYV